VNFLAIRAQPPMPNLENLSPQKTGNEREALISFPIQGLATFSKQELRVSWQATASLWATYCTTRFKFTLCVNEVAPEVNVPNTTMV